MGIEDNKPVIKTSQYKTGGDNVIMFPMNKPTIKRTQIETQLLHMQKFLRFQFKNIKEAMEALSDMQRECSQTEDSYDELLLEYANRIGAENLTNQYMDYSKHVKPVVTEHGIELKYEQ